jgi:hypothetical protein
MKIVKPFLLIFCLSISLEVFSQSIGLNWLFRPGMRFSTTFMPKQTLQDTTQFGFFHVNTSLVIPVSGKAEASLSELNIKANHTFFTANLGSRFLQTNLLPYQKLAHNFSFGVTHVQADIKNGIWFYTFNMGLVESPETFDKIKPFFIGAVAKIVLKGLRTYNIYGVGLTYNYNQIIPFPLFGINRFLSDKIQVSMILPAYAELIYSSDDNLEIALRGDFSVFRSGVLPLESPPPPLALRGEKSSLQYRDVRLGLLARYNPSSKVKFQAHAGVAAFRSLRVFSDNTPIRSFIPALAPFFNLAVHINFGNAPINSQLFGNEF